MLYFQRLEDLQLEGVTWPPLISGKSISKTNWMGYHSHFHGDITLGISEEVSFIKKNHEYD